VCDHSGRCGQFGSVVTSPDLVMPSLPVGRRRCSFLRSSPYQTDDPGRPVDLLGGKAKRERSDPAGRVKPVVPSTHPVHSCQRSRGRQRGRRPSASPERSDRVPPSTRRRPSPLRERSEQWAEAGGTLLSSVSTTIKN